MQHILNFREKMILEDILSPLILLENNNETINESVFQKVLDKVKSYAKSGLLTTTLLTGLLATPGLTNAQQSEIKKIDWNKMIDKTSEVVKKTGDEIKRRVDDKDFWGTKQDNELKDTIVDNDIKDIKEYEKTLAEYEKIAKENGGVVGIGKSMDYNISKQLAYKNGINKLSKKDVSIKKSDTIITKNENGDLIYRTLVIF